MGRKVICYVLILVLDLLISSASCSRLPKSRRVSKEEQSQKQEITYPITTVPTIIPAPFATSTSPVINPTSDPDSVVTPSIPVAITSPPPSLSSSWCIASPSSSQIALQVALDYACGYGGADCSGIQSNGKCYYPNSVRDHASYAFNQYYQKNPLPTSCNFAGTAVVTNTDPSTGSCQYPSTSTSSSILNTTNASGAPVFGAVPSGPTTSAAARSRDTPTRIWRSLVMSSVLLLARICI
ncbi:carbohydrate-binding X8 domain-containing protein-like [Punica granatum]|uniref:Carbohydrate-binding X8 domain-containing protein-like n=2 Tax=Punica granatum TaxID=22663 RepID=A0A6P8D669_PUNGR|nr:carbohydrate-binding X8 domain-containing protein-like [Punica granatum]PKI55691.1 hypothetical protein CRG98_023907 [Punica granatum]